jgi:hypothetical protein
VREYRFELRLCAYLEDHRDGVVGRQLGGGVDNPGTRVNDVIHVAPGDEFEHRRRIGSDTIPEAALDAPAKVGTVTPVTDLFETTPERAREIAERAAEAGFFERERRGGRTVVRQTTVYPDWFSEITAIENKPDLDRPGALARQLRFDVALGMYDRVILATADHVTGAHLNRVPDPVGVWRFDPESGERTVIREASSLPVSEAGTEIFEEHPLRTVVAFVDAPSVRKARRRVAERVWGKGWRPERLPGCGQCEATAKGLPYCRYFDRVVNPMAECGPACAGHTPAPAPPVDVEAKRAEHSPWDPDSAAFVSEQAELDRFD